MPSPVPFPSLRELGITAEEEAEYDAMPPLTPLPGAAPLFPGRSSRFIFL